MGGERQSKIGHPHFMFSLENKIALVTGAGSGIGAAIAETFARAGAAVFVTDKDDAAGGAVAESLSVRRLKAAFLRLDVASEEGCAETAREVLARHGRLDILVNNAGIGHVGTMRETTAADLDRLYQVNLRGVFNVSKAFFASMLERRAGVIVNMASIAGVLAVRDRLAYTIMKFGVVGLTKAMALDHAQDGIRVNCICPGRVETPFVTARLREYPDPEKAYKEMSSTQLLGRMGKPEEIAAAALYLASDEAAFITGTALLIDGGWSVGK
jgi:NAD(P)-dependent dehydrogenase (short-subunit alcohol dehydrogenase family)